MMCKYFEPVVNILEILNSVDDCFNHTEYACHFIDNIDTFFYFLHFAVKIDL